MVWYGAQPKGRKILHPLERRAMRLEREKEERLAMSPEMQDFLGVWICKECSRQNNKEIVVCKCGKKAL